MSPDTGNLDHPGFSILSSDTFDTTSCDSAIGISPTFPKHEYESIRKLKQNMTEKMPRGVLLKKLVYIYLHILFYYLISIRCGIRTQDRHISLPLLPVNCRGLSIGINFEVFCTFNKCETGCRHSSVVSSSPTILRPRFESQAHHLRFIQLVLLKLLLELEKNENKQK